MTSKTTQRMEALSRVWDWWRRVHLGQSTGRGRNDRFSGNKVPIKDIYIYPLHRQYKETLQGER